jgi:chromosome partitioning protein
MPSKIISIANQKGGVGKTSLTRLIGINLAERGRRVLLIDADPQGNLTKSLIDDGSSGKGMSGLYEALSSSDYEIPEVMPNLYILAGDIRLANLEKSLIGEMDAYTRLRDLLSMPPFAPSGESKNMKLEASHKGLGDEGEFEYILIDSPPSLGLLTINALTASKYILAPMNPAIYSLQGTNDLMATVAKVKKNLNPDLTFLGVIINAFDAHPVITRQIREEIVASFGELVFRTALSRSVKVEEALAARRGLVAGESKVGDEMKRIGEELIERIEKLPQSHEGGMCE